MKYLKMLSLLAVAGAALLAFAGSASATDLRDSSGGLIPVGTEITGEVENGHAILHGSLGITIECNQSHVKGTLGSQTPSSSTASGNIASLTFGGCTNGMHVHVKKAGSLEIHTDPLDATGTSGNGTLTSSGAEVEVTITSLGITCIYTTNNTDIGTLTGSKHQLSTGKAQTATLDIAGNIPRTGGSGLCGATGSWTGSYVVSKPDYLDVR